MASSTRVPGGRRWIIPVLTGLALGVALLLRLWRIDSIPPGFHFDESFEGLEAWRILTEPGYRPLFLTGNFGVPPLNAYANALTFWLFERFGGQAGPTAMRTTAAILGAVGVAAVYALGDELRRLDRRLSPLFPLLAAAALAVMRWHLHFSRMGIEPVMVPALWAGAFWLLLRGWRTGSRLSFAGCGVLLAAGMYAYQGAWVIPFLAVAGVAILALHSRGKQTDAVNGSPASVSPARRRQGVLLAGGLAFLLFLPLGLFFARNLELVFLRPTQIAVVGDTGSPADNSVWTSTVKTAAMFWPLGETGDLDPRRNLPGAPALDIWLAIPFFLGVVMSLLRLGSPVSWLLLMSLAGLLAPGMISEYAPHFHRILGAAAPTALLVGLGLDAIWQRRPRGSRAGTAITALLLVGLLLAAGVNTARTYFGRWAPLPDLFYAFDVGFWELGQWMAAQPPGTPLYITPRGLEHATLDFAWRTRAGAFGDDAPVAFDGRHIFPLTAGENPLPEFYAVIEHEDFRTRLLLPELFPQAAVAWELADPQGAAYARIYRRPAGVREQRPPAHTVCLPPGCPTPGVELGDGIHLLGYDLLPERPRAGEILYLQLHWGVEAPPAGDWTVFTHVVDGAGQVVAGKDGLPGNGSLATSRWQAGWRVLDEYQIELPADLPPGDYSLRAGLYRADGARLPAQGPGVELGPLPIDPAP